MIEGIEIALTDLAGVSDEVARIGLPEGQLLDMPLFHVGG